jgi:hypothetical protein
MEDQILFCMYYMYSFIEHEVRHYETTALSRRYSKKFFKSCFIIIVLLNSFKLKLMSGRNCCDLDVMEVT